MTNEKQAFRVGVSRDQWQTSIASESRESFKTI